jgi:hypothetical protein
MSKLLLTLTWKFSQSHESMRKKSKLIAATGFCEIVTSSIGAMTGASILPAIVMTAVLVVIPPLPSLTAT